VRQAIFYFVAAALFATAAAIAAFNDGVTVKTGFGVIMTGVMIWLGVQAKRARL
jgi:hypothetical protein